MRLMGRLLRFAAAMFLVSACFAEDSAQLIFQNGSVRDVAFAPAGDAIYIASYAGNEIVELNPADGAVRRRASVPGGPSAIAVNGDAIAVLSRAASTITILGASDFSPRGTVALNKGASQLLNAGSGRIAALNNFASEIQLIDLASQAIVATTALPGGVPVDAAYDGARIVVAGRADALLWWLDATTLALAATSQLSAAPHAIESCAPGRILVATDDSLIELDAERREILRTVAIQPKRLVASGATVLSVEAGQVRVLNSSLQVIGTWALPDGAEFAQVSDGACYVWSPSAARVWRLNAAQARVAEAVPAATPAAATEIAAVTPAPSPDAPAEPAPTAPEIKQEPVPLDPPAKTSAPATEAAASARSEGSQATTPPPDPPAIAEPSPEAAPAAVPYSLTVQPTRLRLGGFRPYAPHFGDPTGRTFHQALDHALNAGNDPDSLMSAEFPNAITNLKFGGELKSVGLKDKQAAAATGGVEFDLGDVHTQAESITLNTQPRELQINGPARFTRGESVLAADSIQAFDTIPPEIPGYFPIIPSRHEKPIPHPLVPSGYREPRPPANPPLGTIELSGVNWDEGERRLIADRMEFNTLARRADLENVNGNTGPVYFGAKELRVHGTNEISAEDFWITTCDLPEPHYRLRVSHVTTSGPNEVVVQHARLQVGRTNTPLYLPRYAASLVPGEGSRLGTEFAVAGSTALGTYANVAQWFEINDNLDLAPRIYATAKQGIGFGFDARYDYMKDPASPLYRSTGEMRTLRTTEDNGYTEWYHRQELTPDTVMLFQSEQWYERDVIKDFYSNDYENRTGPRTFLSIAHTRPEYMATGTVAPSTHDFTSETEKLPELTFHMFERRLPGGFYATFDTYEGYYETEPDTVEAVRSATVGRISYDWNVARGFNVLPFVELHGTYYSRTLDDTADDFDGTVTTGVTVQSRLQRNYPGIGNFTGFKHIIIPSTTLSYRPDATIDAQDLPQFDSLDKRPGRLRVETTLDNIVLGKNAANNMVWPVGRLTFYTGTDLENEAIKSNDYEVDLEIRPRPSWGTRTVAEIHDVSNSSDLPGEDFNRVITYAFYDNRLQENSLNGRVGFAFTESGPGVLNKEVLYGLGYKFAKNWSFAFDQRYDFEREEFTRQTYTLRRKLHDWEIAFLVRDRQDSLDIGFSINLVDFPEIGAGL